MTNPRLHSVNLFCKIHLCVYICSIFSFVYTTNNRIFLGFVRNFPRYFLEGLASYHILRVIFNNSPTSERFFTYNSLEFVARYFDTSMSLHSERRFNTVERKTERRRTKCLRHKPRTFTHTLVVFVMLLAKRLRFICLSLKCNGKKRNKMSNRITINR